MTTRPGEDLAASLYADVHYFYSQPSAKPPHHRFDKQSYVYLFENASQRRARLEIANHAGTPDQDAFDGHLDGARVKYSYRHSTLVTLTIDHSEGQEWHLPSFDPTNSRKYMYRLHTLDIYFWTFEYAIQFVNSIRRVLPQQQITILDEPIVCYPHHGDRSVVVQKLEDLSLSHVACQKPHGDDQFRRSRSSLPGPPISATPQNNQYSNYAPLAYNPAAPAAPEMILPREKTPPPEDGDGNPLMATASSNSDDPSYFLHGQGESTIPQRLDHAGPPGKTAKVSLLSSPDPPLTYAESIPSPFSSPSTEPIHETSHFSVTTPPTYHQLLNSSPKSTPPHAPVAQYADYPSSPGFARAVSTPGQYPSGYFTPVISRVNSSQYHHPNNNIYPSSFEHPVHQQVYRPNEQESEIKAGKALKSPTGKFEERAAKLEKGVGNLFKKLERKIG